VRWPAVMGDRTAPHPRSRTHAHPLKAGASLDGHGHGRTATQVCDLSSSAPEFGLSGPDSNKLPYHQPCVRDPSSRPGEATQEYSAPRLTSAIYNSSSGPRSTSSVITWSFRLSQAIRRPLNATAGLGAAIRKKPRFRSPWRATSMSSTA
jgi:hypothetical protein